MTGVGTAGQTHCGSWTSYRAGDGNVWITRVICTRQPNHKGLHRHKFYHLEWGPRTPVRPTRKART